jgi:hypothetical protein
MNVGDWLSCDNDPERMADFLRGKGSDRKLRLFAVACCRRIWHFLEDEGRQAVELAEGYADGVRTPDELMSAYRIADEGADRILDRSNDTEENERAYYAALAALWAADEGKADLDVEYLAMHAAHYAARAAGFGLEVFEQDKLLHDILGDERPRPARAKLPWLAWQNGMIIHLARGIYEERAFERLPYLADALEEAGCTDEALLEHCHRPNRHVLGCWALDWILGKG